MAFVKTNCPNCGGQMEEKNGQYYCEFCGTQVLNIVDAKIDGDVAVISPEEFQKKLDESKSQFIIKIDNDLKVFDARTEIINTRIKQAQAAVLEGKFGAVNELLSGVPDTIVAAERLRLLAVCEVHNESEFVYGADISKGQKHLDNILHLADEETVKTYQAIVKYNQENKAREAKTREKIAEVFELVQIGSLDSAIKYMEQVASADSTNPRVWTILARLYYRKNGVYNGKKIDAVRGNKIVDLLIKQYQALSLMDCRRYCEALIDIVNNYKGGGDFSVFWFRVDKMIREPEKIKKIMKMEEANKRATIMCFIFCPVIAAIVFWIYCLNFYSDKDIFKKNDDLNVIVEKKKKEYNIQKPEWNPPFFHGSKSFNFGGIKGRTFIYDEKNDKYIW